MLENTSKQNRIPSSTWRQKNSPGSTMPPSSYYRESACWQNLTPNAVAPLVHIVEVMGKGSLLGKVATEAALSLPTPWLTSLGRHGGHYISKLRIFEEAAPHLLGSVFEMKMKAHLESLKCRAGTTKIRRSEV